MTMKRTSFCRHNLKKSLKSAANLIFAIEGFSEFFECVEPFRRSGSTPVGAGFVLRFFETVDNHEFPLGAAPGGTCFLGCCELLFHTEYLHLRVAGSMRRGGGMAV